ncbi:hypothetical protein FNYG_13307 [Fusarium nygamai]|uniref:Heterokaryon incompatibility domain-containing protein n=1 Tax=Gibberella nygamai TaxID=42673 RepID=A0A2K0VTJ2_GIBNY|nr:hypothetical protein FNYG_13307 [Fusarium nygamai]
MLKWLHHLCLWVNRFGNEEAKASAIAKHWSPQFWPLRPEVAASFMLLGRHLTVSICRIYNYHHLKDSHYPWGTSSLFGKKWMQNGWCHNDVAEIFPNLQPDAQCYYGLKSPPYERREHRHCSAQACIEDHLDESRYQTKHVPGHESWACPFVGPSMVEINAILDEGDIPLLRWSPVSKRLAVISYRPGMKYVAFSHVWSDGLGNRAESALPICQLSRLQAYVDKLYDPKDISDNALISRPERLSFFKGFGNSGDIKANCIISTTLGGNVPNFDGYFPWNDEIGLHPGEDEENMDNFDPEARAECFWVDTLCIPVDPRSRRQKKKAIANMNNVFRNADRTLVLDSRILGLSRDGQYSMRDCIDNMYHSRWMRRLWTFLEGALSTNIFFQFRDWPLCLDGLFEFIRRSLYKTNAVWEDILVRTMQELYMYRHVLREKDLSQAFDFAGEEFGCVVEELRRRKSTKLGDESICIAHLLDVDPSPLLEVPDTSRMGVLLKMIGHVPTALIFFGGQKLEEQGLTWAPKSFLQMASVPLPLPWQNSLRDTSKLTSEGLRVRFPGAIISGTSLLPSSSKLFITSNKTNSLIYRVWFEPRNSEDSRSFPVVEKLGLVFYKHDRTRNQDYQEGSVVPGVLLSVRKGLDGKRVGKWLGLVQVAPVNEATEMKINKALRVVRVGIVAFTFHFLAEEVP